QPIRACALASADLAGRLLFWHIRAQLGRLCDSMNIKRKAPFAAGLIVLSVYGLRGAAPPHRASLSDDLRQHQTRHTTARTRVIVHGDPFAIDAIADRYHLQVLRRLERLAVLAANSDELDRLSGDPAITHLSSDPPVANWMSVSNASTAADQVRAGTSGLLGIGGVAAVNGQGIGVAIPDSGISNHPAPFKTSI